MLPGQAGADGSARRRSDRVASEEGRPIGDLAEHGAEVPERVAAYKRMMARLKEGASLGGVQFDREEIHDREDRQSCD